jgi:cob(I)alamin adenosyltransferase
MRPRISTGSGDDGSTGLLNGLRASKSSARLHAYGSIDELNAILGVVLAEELPAHLAAMLRDVQRVLFQLGSDLATPEHSTPAVPRVDLATVHALEERAHALEEMLPPLKRFILPGGTRSAAFLHQARTVCRRAERWMVELRRQEWVNGHALVYVNRLSDMLFLASRVANAAAGVAEEEWR